ncbi:MAG TPA: DUF1801 domain-containing protein [Thermoplasmata archaeon]|nr:DUF1801 domain-containing protein [Thermoplasmata archaeon]
MAPSKSRAPGGSATAKGGKKPPAATNVDEYLARVPDEVRLALEALRRTILTAVPGSTERIEYGMPVVHHRGPLVGFAAQKRPCAFYVMSPALVDAHAAELKPFDVGRACIRFVPEHPLPSRLVTELVQARVSENAARAAG